MGGDSKEFSDNAAKDDACSWKKGEAVNLAARTPATCIADIEFVDEKKVADDTAAEGAANDHFTQWLTNVDHVDLKRLAIPAIPVGSAGLK